MRAAGYVAALLLLAQPLAAFRCSAVSSISSIRSSYPGARMATVAPDRTETKPSVLPETWEVPDTFSLSSLRKPDDTDPAMFKITLFKSSATESRVVGALMEVIDGMDRPRAELINQKVKTMGFGLVGVWSQKKAEQYGDELQRRGLVCDVSPE